MKERNRQDDRIRTYSLRRTYSMSTSTNCSRYEAIDLTISVTRKPKVSASPTKDGMVTTQDGTFDEMEDRTSMSFACQFNNLGKNLATSKASMQRKAKQCHEPSSHWLQGSLSTKVNIAHVQFIPLIMASSKGLGLKWKGNSNGVTSSTCVLHATNNQTFELSACVSIGPESKTTSQSESASDESLDSFAVCFSEYDSREGDVSAWFSGW